MFEIDVASAAHRRHYSVLPAGDAGWEARLEEDSAVRWSGTYADWHRVERAVARIQREVAELVERGWIVVPPNQSMKR